MAKVFDDLTTRFMSFSDALEAQFSDISIPLPSIALKGRATAAAGPAAGDARALIRAAEEREAAKKRGEDILQQLPPGYFESSFDALRHELNQMGPDAKQDDVDVVVDRLTAAMEVVGMRLARHVLNNQDKLIAGITTVTHVEDDVKAAFVVCQGARAQLRMAADEVQRQIKIITSTRKKQHSMELLDVLSRVQKVQNLPALLRRAHEEGDHAEAILLCVDCFHAVDTLSLCKIAPALQVAVQRAYYDAMQHLHNALLNVCTDFQGESYSRLLEAYLLQGVPPEALADKVLSCFNELFKAVSTRLVRSLVLARAFEQDEQHDSPRSSAGGLQLEECSFAELCRRVHPSMLPTCCLKLLEALFDLLASYHEMLLWHEASLAEHTQAAAAAAAAAASAAARSPGQSQDGAAVADDAQPAAADTAPSQEQLQQVQAATKAILAGVQAALQANRMATAESAAVLVKELLVGAGGCPGSDFPQVVACCLRFVSLAEAFAAGKLPTRDALMHMLGALVRGSHKSNMQALKQALAVEAWGAVPDGRAPGSEKGTGNPVSSKGLSAPDVTCIQRSLESSNPHSNKAFGEDGFMGSFTDWLKKGNTFRRQGRAVGGTSVLNEQGSKATAASAGDGATGTGLISASPNTSSTIALRKTSSSSLLVLQWLADYAGLMVLLPGQQQQLWAGMAELFDNYMLACFVLFSGVSLQTLVWQDDCLPNRLRSCLLRITTSEGCKYKAEVEELQRTKRVPAALNEAASSTFSSSASTTSKIDVFTRKFKNTMVELINTDLSQPISDPHGHNPMQLTPGQQQQQHRSSTPSTPGTPGTPGQQQPAAPLSVQQQQQQQSGDSGAATSSSTLCATEASAGGLTRHSEQSGVQAMFLKQCVSAVDSLTLLASALKAGKPALLQQLRMAGVTKEAESYFARTVDAAADLTEAIYLDAAKQLLPGLADKDYGLASTIAGCNYNMQQPATCYQPWVAEVVQQYEGFASAVVATELPVDVQHKFWEAALRLGAEAMLAGVGQVRRCSQQGRAAMSLDLSAVEKGLRAMAPPSALSSLRRVDNYIKAFYTPWEELGRWAQTHLPEYGKGRILVLVEAMADAYGIKRGQRAALMDSINAQLTEFA